MWYSKCSKHILETKLNLYTLGLHAPPFLLRNGNRTFVAVQALRTKCKGIWRWNHGRIFSLHNSGKGHEQWENIAQSPFTHSAFLKLDLLGATLVDKIILVSSVQFYDTWSAYCTGHPPPRVSSPSITIHLPPLSPFATPPPAFPLETTIMVPVSEIYSVHLFLSVSKFNI